MTVLAPYAASHSHTIGAAWLYVLFSPFCHQIGDRSFHLAGHAWAVCHRCSGIYLGALVAALGSFWRQSDWRGNPDKKWVYVGIMPILLDAGLDAAGFWANSPMSRFVSGALFGALLSPLLLAGISEFVHDLVNRPSSPAADPLGGNS